MISKHFRILDFSLATLWTHKTRNLCIIVIFSFEVFLLTSILFMGQALKREAQTLLSGSPSVIVQKMSAGRHSWIPLTYVETIKQIPGVRQVVPRIWGYYYDPPTQANYTLTSTVSHPTELVDMLEGRMFTEDDLFGCIIGQGVAELRLLEIGDLIPVKGEDAKLYGLRVTGIFRSHSRLLTNDLIVVSEDSLRRIFQIPEAMATDLAVDIPNESEINTVTRKIMERLAAVRTISREQILRTYEAIFSWRSGLLLLAFAGFMAAFFVLAWDKASGLSNEEKNIIGILRAIGWEVSEVLEFKIWEGLAISFMSFISGVLAAYLHVFFFGCGLFEPILKGWSVLYPSFQLTPAFEPFTLMAVFFMSVVPYTFATLVPSWSASVTDPDLAMRG